MDIQVWNEDIERLLRFAVDRHGRLVRYIASYGEDFEDVLQHLRVELWRRLPLYDGKHRLSTFVFAVTRAELLRLAQFLNRPCRAGWRDRVPLLLENEDGELDEYLEDTSLHMEEDVVASEILEHVRRGLLGRYSEHEVEEFIGHITGSADISTLSRGKRAGMMRLTRRIINSYMEAYENV